jgi:predicted alpha/beta-fold hydrolase
VSAPGELPSDRFVRPVAQRVSRTVSGAAALPLLLGFAGAQRVAGGVHALAARVPARPVAPPARPLEPLSADAAYGRIMAAVPPPSAISTSVAMRALAGGLHDWPLMLLTAKPERALLGFRYPRGFRHRVFAGADGEPIAALLGLQPEPARPAVVLCHGAMTTKHFDYVRRTALRLHALGLHVLAIDLRGFGVTALTSAAPSSTGFKEGEDVCAAAEFLRGLGATRVAAIGFSLGGAAVLNAARVASERPGCALDGGILSLSAPTDMASSLDRASRRPPLRDRFFGTWLTLRAAATSRARAEGWTTRPVSPLEAVEQISAPYYGMSAHDLALRSSAVAFAADVRVPVLHVHAADDVVVPVAQARALRDAAAGNPHVRVLILPHGGHAAFDLAAPALQAALEREWTRVSSLLSNHKDTLK